MLRIFDLFDISIELSGGIRDLYKSMKSDKDGLENGRMHFFLRDMVQKTTQKISRGSGRGEIGHELLQDVLAKSHLYSR